VWANRTPSPEYSRRLAVLVASGLIVGESLFGVLNAGLIVGFSSDAPLALVPADFAYMNEIGLGLFTLLVVVLYAWIMKRARAFKPA
jgi:hypothetical protein